MSLRTDLGLALQYLMPHQLLSRLVYWATRWTWRPWKDLLIDQIATRFKVNWEEAGSTDKADYPSFNAFFTRSLKADARPINADPNTLISPADGAISQLGPIHAGRIVQAKGMDYSVAELLADETLAEQFAHGSFATVYLSPRDYHRVHLPFAGRLVQSIHIPGRLFSVAPWTTANIPRLFARNERLVCLFETEHGPLAVVLVGAILVSSIETVFSGLVTPPYASSITRRNHDQRFEKGAEIGRFNMGSTAIVLSGFVLDFEPDLVADAPVKMGAALARVAPATDA